MKRGDTSLQRTMSNTINRNPERHMNVVLPEGFKTSDVSRVMTDQEMRLLKDDAEEQAISFEMLRHKDVLTLSKVCIKVCPGQLKESEADEGRSYGCLMSAVSTFEKHTHLYGRVARICTRG